MLNMTSWLGDTVSDKVGEAVAYKIANRDGIKPEPSSLLDVTENGSNFKVRMNMPSVSLYVLKVSDSSSISPLVLVNPAVDFAISSDTSSSY